MGDILERVRRTITPRQSYMRSGDDDLMAEMVAEIEHLRAAMAAFTAPAVSAEAVDGVFSIHFDDDATAERAFEAWGRLNSKGGDAQ